MTRITALIGLYCLPALASGPVEVGRDRQLFIDDYVIAKTKGVKLTLNQPTKYAGNPVLVADKPWEKGSVAVYGTVLYDEQDKCFKMWYRAIDDTCYACYATSKDGIRWDKPVLGIKEHKGSTQNNIVLGKANPKFYLDGFAVIKEADEADPKRRYKMLTYNGGRRFAAMVSPDGLHWSGPINPKQQDTGDVVSMYRDTGLGKYVALLKRRWVFNDKDGNQQKRRARLISLSEDFVKWSNPQWAIVPDKQDPFHTHFYSHVAYMYQGLRIGYVTVFMKDTELIDTQLCYSRDGASWHRYRERIPFLPCTKGTFDAGMLLAGASGLVIRDGKIWIYYCGYSTDHAGRDQGGGKCKNGIGLAHLRLDGFVSVDAGPNGGTLLTKPLIWRGNSLRINANAVKGQVRAELVDAKGKPIPGYDPAASLPFKGDSLNAPLRWKRGSPDALGGQAVSIRFHLTAASLYSFWLADD
jgi:hypothetical protein